MLTIESYLQYNQSVAAYEAYMKCPEKHEEDRFFYIFLFINYCVENYLHLIVLSHYIFFF